MLNPFRYCNYVRRINPVTIGSNVEISSILGPRHYAKDKGGCCKDVSQTDGKQVVDWPKGDAPPPAWRANCLREPQPPNYDPYRIKVPDIVVPPLPPSNAKEMPIEEFNIAYAGVRDLFHNSPIIHPDCWKEKRRLPRPVHDYQLRKLGYHGKEKYKYAFHEPWKPLDRLTLLAEAEKDDLGQIDMEKEVIDKQIS